MATAADVRAGGAFVQFYAKGDKQVQAALNDMQNRLNRMGTRVAYVGAAMSGMGVAITGTLTAALAYFVSTGSEMQDMSDRTGVAVEALSELRHAAEQNGATAEDLERGLRAMDLFLVSAANNAPAAISALEQLGLTFEELNGLSRDQQFSRIAEGISQVENASNRAALASDIFSRSGSRLMILLRSGASGIASLRDEARRLGLTMSSEDASAAETFGDSLANLVKVFKMVAFHAGAAVAPIVRQFLVVAIEGAAAVNHFIRENRVLVQAIAAVGVALVAGGTAFLALAGTLYVVGAAFGVMASTLAYFGGVFGLIKAAIILGVPGLSSAFVAFNVVLSATSSLMAAWSASVAIGFTVAASAAWAFNTAMSAGAAVFGLFTGVTAAATAATGGYTLGAMIATFWTAIWTGGLNLLAGAIGAVVLASGGFVLVGLAIAGAALALSAFDMRFADLHSSLGFLDDLADWFGGVWDQLSVYFGMLTNWFHDSGLADFLADVSYAVVGVGALIAGIISLAGYAVYLGVRLLFLSDIWDRLASGNGEALNRTLAVLNDIAGAIGIVFRTLFSMPINLGRSLIGNFAETVSGLMSNIMASVSRVMATMSGAVASTISGFRTMLSGLVGDAVTVWGAIQDAFGVGDWAGIWDLVRASAMLAFARISFFAVSMFYTWKDALIDVFTSVWATVRSIFATGWAALRVSMFETLFALSTRFHEIYNQVATAIDRVNYSINDEERFRLLNERLDRAGFVNEQVRQLVLTAQRDLARETNAPRHEGPSPAEQDLRRRRDEALAAGNTVEINRLENQLADLMMIQDLDRQLGGQSALGPSPAVESQIMGASRSAGMGTFSADAAARMFGGSGNTMETLAREQRDRLDRIVELLRQQAQGEAMG